VSCLSGAAFVQDGLLKNLSAGDFDKILKEEIKKDFTKQEIKGGFRYSIKDTPFFVQFSSEKFIMFYAVVDDPKNITLEKLNAWNVDAIYSRAYLLNNKEVRFEIAFTYAGGVTPATVKEYYVQTEKEWKEFSAKVLGR
jgi:hypothetical protein